MKLIIGSFIQETNSFSTFKTDLQSFEEYEFLAGDEIISYNIKKKGGLEHLLKLLKRKTYNCCLLFQHMQVQEG